MSIDLTSVSQLFPKDCRTVCFTGPRPNELHGYVKDPYFPIVDLVTELVGKLADSGTVRFISGGAQGFDQLAFWAVDRIVRRGRADVRNVVYVPFPGQPSRWNKSGPFGRDEYGLMLRRASEVLTLAADPADPNDGRAATQLMFQRNHAMVRDADLVVALLAGRSLDWRDSKGGTAECVRHAVGRNKPVLTVGYRPSDAEPFRIGRIN